MAIAFDTANDGVVMTSDIGASWTHVNSGNLLVVESVFGNDTAFVAVATYNSVSADGAIASAGNGWKSYLIWWLDPPTGSHTVALTFSTTVSGASRSASYTGVDTGVAEVTNTGTDASNANAPTVSVTTTQDNSVVIGVYENHTRQEFAGSNTTMRTDNAQGDGIFDNLGSVGAAGSYHLNVNTGVTASPWSVCVAAFAPTTGGGSTVPVFMNLQRQMRN